MSNQVQDLVGRTNTCTVVPLYVATLSKSHSSDKATILENKPCMIVSDITLTRGHPLKRPDFPFPKGGLIRGGPLYSGSSICGHLQQRLLLILYSHNVQYQTVYNCLHDKYEVHSLLS